MPRDVDVDDDRSLVLQVVLQSLQVSVVKTHLLDPIPEFFASLAVMDLRSLVHKLDGLCLDGSNHQRDFLGSLDLRQINLLGLTSQCVLLIVAQNYVT